MVYKARDVGERFWEKVQRTDDCWLWTASKNQSGYGKFGIDYKTYGAHRVAWELTYSPIPPNTCVLHTCDNPECVKPDHLFLGDQADNLHDMIIKGRRGYTGHKGERNAKAKLTDEQVRSIRSAFAVGRTRAELAKEYMVNWSTVDRIVKRERWKHV